ncbi:hypothetical protein BSLG_000472 [Batrachochytrium salamandrivorans]|nr:hypothetical protein BSLG_000472 [Batrachochytrium salamandrivorans]
MFASMHGWNLERRRKGAVAPGVDAWVICGHTTCAIQNLELPLPWAKEGCVSVKCCSPPQPAGLSEKYSNNVDATLASGLEARSYQPELNSRKDSATLVSLERRDNSGSGQPPRPASLREVAPNRLYNPFYRTETATVNISATIDNVGDDALALDRWREFEGNNVYGTIKSVLGEDEYSRISRLVIRKDIDLNNWTQDKLIEVLDAVSNIEKKHRL